MTALVERPAPASSPVVTETSVSPRPPVGAVVGLIVLVVLVAAGLAGYGARVAADYPVAAYQLDSASTPWVEADPAGPSTAFRIAPVLPSAPVSATLWVDARDTYRAWVNGRAVAENQGDARTGARPVAAGVDVRSLLKAGPNVLAVQARGLGDDNGALWTRLDLRFANGSTSRLGSDGAQWLATSDVTRTGSSLGGQPGFADAGFSTDGWTRPRVISPVRSIDVAVPAEVVDAVATPAALGAVTTAGGTATYRLRLTAPRSTDAWLRLSATGAADVTINGGHVTDRPAPGYVSTNSHRPAPLWLIHIGNRLHTGVNDIVIQVGAETFSSLVVTTIVRTDAGWTAVPVAAQQWTADTSAGTGLPLTVGSSTATSGFPNGFTASAVPETGLPVPWRALGIGAAVGLILALAVLAGVRTRVPVTDTGPRGHRLEIGTARLGRIVLAALPAVAVIAVALVLGRWVTVTPGLAYRPIIVIFALIAVLVGPAVAGILRLTSRWLTSRRRASHRRVAGTAEPDAGSTGRSARWRTSARAVATPVRRVAWLTPSRAGVIAITALSTFAQGWRLGRQPIWQDEATSLVVARAIKAHGLPRLESGLYYFKGELYHALIAGLLTITDSTTAIRAVSLLWFAGTVLVFGLLLMPLLSTNPWVIVAATALLVVVPAELTWARDVRMYQQMQFFAVLFIALLLRAMRDGRRRDIVFSAVAMLAMYLSHEESFVMLPAVPIVLVLAWRTVWPQRRTYLAAYTPAFVVVVIQYAVSHLHPVDFGEDLSNRPYVGWDPQQADFYYQKVFFTPLSSASLAVLSTLAVIGAVVAVRRRDSLPTMLAVILGVTVATTSLLFTAKVDRYSFIVVPALVALAVLGAVGLTSALARWCRSRRGAVDGRSADASPVWVRWAGGLTVGVLAVATVATLAVSPREYGLWAADASGTLNPLTHNDYRPTVTSLRAQVQPTDGVITLSPPVMTELYLGRRPDRVIQTGRNKLLYVVLRDGQAVDTLLGVRVVLTAADLRTYLEAHRRVWLVSDTGSYLQGIPPDVQAEVQADFHIVIQNATTTVSVWDLG